jgi:alpha(1,3/1,4) fucosyltransferase
MLNKTIFVDPSYDVFNGDLLFDLSDPVLNRDDQLRALSRLRDNLMTLGMEIHTADFLFNGACSDVSNEYQYYSLGLISNFKKIAADKLARLTAFVYLEPPIVAPELYNALPSLSAAFDSVYLPNTHGDGYSLEGVDTTKLCQMYWPIPYNDVLQPFWGNRDRLLKIVVINGNHKPRLRKMELYSTRIEAMSALANFGAVDLFGRGWDNWWARASMWLPYWRNYNILMSVYRGTCKSKFEILSRYKFCLCFENMAMDGYITEKIFDCIYAGTIPLYLGAPNISKFIPEDAYVDCRKFISWEEMWREVSAMPDNRIDKIRQAGRDFLASDAAMRFYNSFDTIFTNFPKLSTLQPQG